ncbi:S8 family peptidase [Aquabacterium sp.]|uniref:S8 family peptidase n=1 Tax=Aquabacterium sp. TaxID=1872578 RepID=UPI002CA59359|nr:S8/S53 family peptidase [Aquabacterium sp.]HSW03333.1 S8/S53 family peptidase [Aquabacterium sp.]
MNNYALKTDGRPLNELEKKLRKYLPGLDVRLWAYSPLQAVIRAPLVRALEIEYPNIGAGPLLKVLGVAEIRQITDEETVALLAGRDTQQLPALKKAVPAPVAGVDWHLDLVRAPAAWQLLGGPDDIAWGDTVVGHIDTGYTPHPVFGFPAASWLNVALARTFMPPLPPGEGSMFVDEPGGGLDTLSGVNGGHGTRIAATICGHAPAAPGGAYFGIAPKVPLVPMRITDVVLINHAQRQFAEAVDHAVNTAGAKVINVSLGVFAAAVVKPMKRAINQAYDAGVIMVCAAGNQVNSVVAPARLARTVAVGGITHKDVPWSGSSFGPEVDMSGPAADLRRASTTAGNQFGYGGGGDGTSYATAMTSGAAALWLTHRRTDIAQAYAQPWQRVAAFTLLLRSTARVPAGWQSGAFGTGVLNIEALLNAPLPAAASLVQEAPV